MTTISSEDMVIAKIIIDHPHPSKKPSMFIHIAGEQPILIDIHSAESDVGEKSALLTKRQLMNLRRELNDVEEHRWHKAVREILKYEVDTTHNKI